MKWSLEARRIDGLSSYDKNPRRLTETQRHQLATSIDKFGIIDKPVLNFDGTIIGGHQRIAVLRDKGVEVVDCWIPDHKLEEKEVEELNIRLNRNNGEWDFDILANAFDIGNLLEWGFEESDLGFSREEKPKKPIKPTITLEFADKETMLNYIAKCEEIAVISSAKLKIKG